MFHLDEEQYQCLIICSTIAFISSTILVLNEKRRWVVAMMLVVLVICGYTLNIIFYEHNPYDKKVCEIEDITSFLKAIGLYTRGGVLNFIYTGYGPVFLLPLILQEFVELYEIIQEMCQRKRKIE